MLQVEEAAMKYIAIYVRVSKRRGQDVRSQLPDLERWAAAQDQPVKWYRDKFTGKTMDRPGWKALESDLGKVSTVVCWRCDRLGRTAKGLTALFADLQANKVNLVSLKDGLDLSTPAGRLMANMLASVAQFETEVRAERILAGQAAARAAGKVWGGGKAGRRVRLSEEKESAIRQLHREGKAIAEIARVVGLSRPTIYKALG
jgi:DNA invertase Pin-like site-specific DNA recombinase